MEMERRQALLVPPIQQIVMLTAVSEQENLVLSALLRLKERILSLMQGQFADFQYPAGICCACDGTVSVPSDFALSG